MTDVHDIKIKNWAHFQSLVDRLLPTRDVLTQFGARPLFRGQSDSAWGLTPSLYRRLKQERSSRKDFAIGWEAKFEYKRLALELIQDFYDRCLAYLSGQSVPEQCKKLSSVDIHNPDAIRAYTFNDVDCYWFSHMQHHQCPTPLLDWSESPYVALFFAVEAGWYECDGTVWAIDPTFCCNDGGDETSENKLRLYMRAQRSERMYAQQSLFTVASNTLDQQDVVRQWVIPASECNHESPSKGFLPRRFAGARLQIPRKLKPEFVRKLHQMNITAETLFPGIDGFGRHLSHRFALNAEGLGILRGQPPKLR